MKVPLTVGAYTAKSLIASAQRCVNLYLEQNPADSPFPTTHYMVPGEVLVATLPSAGCRCLYKASNNALYAIYGQDLYRIYPDFTFKKLGSVNSSVTPVYMRDNGTDMGVVDGSQSGLWVHLADDTVKQITDEAFYGSNRIDVIDGFFVFNRPGTTQFYISQDFSTTLDALDFASKTGSPDLLVCAVVTKHYVYLLGELTCEVWVTSDDPDFPFGRLPGAFIEHGIFAKHSAAVMDGSVYWVSRDPQGVGMVMRTDTFDAKRISTHAIENEFQTYSTIEDAVGYTQQIGGHLFYVLNFPTADKTWVYDLASGQWHEREWIDANGNPHRARAAQFVSWNGVQLVGDWENGNLYRVDPTVTSFNGSPIRCVRSFPHMTGDGTRVFYREFIADMQVGSGLAGTFTTPDVRLRWSDDRGATYGNRVVGSLGGPGEYLLSVQYQRLGYARDRVFELEFSSDTPTALNGAYVQASAAAQ